MILVTGGTGFIGRHLVKSLVDSGQEVRILLRPSALSPRFPKGIPVEVTISSLTDAQGMKAALKGITEVYHLAGAERRGSAADLNKVDVEGTITLVNAARQSKLERIYFLSHIGATRASAYPVLKAKAIAENWIMNSGVPYTIVRSGNVFGPGDQFTEPLLALLKLYGPFFFLPGEGKNLLQPIWIDDLLHCFALLKDDPKMVNRTISIGGIEALPYRQIVEMIAQKINVHRLIMQISPAYLRTISLWVNQLNPRFPVSIFWLDYLAEDHTASIDSLPRQFGLMPKRFHQNLDYLLDLTRRK
jgi:NADH dehydrogenase